MRFLLLIYLMLFNTLGFSYEIENRTLFPALIPVDNSLKVQQLDIISTTDIDQFQPIIDDFQQQHPNVAIEYVTASSTDLMSALNLEGAVFDVAISSAMDLHTKLANDGFAREHLSAQTQSAPSFARWRNEVFTFTEEPAAIVYSPDAFDDLDVPTTRQEIISVLRNHPERFRGKIGTYDVRESGLGYLFASQDSRNSETYWRLTEVMGSLEVKTYCCSSQMIRDVSSGDIAIAYNVLGSYAATQAAQGANIHVLLPEDYTLLMQRSVLIPKSSASPKLAGVFVDHLLNLAWHSSDDKIYPFPRLSNTDSESTNSHIPIRLGAGLLVFLDKLKRQRFIEEWEDSVRQ